MSSFDARPGTFLLALLVSLPAISSGQDESFSKQECLDLFAQAKIHEAETEEGIASKWSTETRRITPGSSGVAPILTTAATLVAGDESGRGFLTYSGKEQTRGQRTRDWALKVSVPFDKTKQEGTFASRSGLSGDIVFSASLSQVDWRIDPEAYGEMLCSICEEVGIPTLLECSRDGLEKFWKTPKGQKSLGVSEEERDAEIERRSAELLKAMIKPTPMFEIQGSVGRKERKYFDADAAERSEDRLGYSISVMGGLLFNHMTLYGRLTGKHDYKQGSTVSWCQPLDEAPDLEKCKELPFGEAAEKESLVAALEVRRFFSSMAMAPAVEYDFEDSEWTFQLPIFLVRSVKNKDKFTAGLKLVWESEDDFGAAIFVTQPLAP